MLSSLIAERYAKALLRAAQAEGALETVGAQALALRAALGHAQGVAAFLADPVSAPGAKLQALEASFPDGPHPLLKSFFISVLELKREAYLQPILEAFEAYLDEAQGRAKVRWGSARPLAPAQRKLLETELGRRLGRQVELQPYEDAALIGGAVLQIQDTIYDASLRTQLKRLGQSLAAGGTVAAQKPAAVAPAKTAQKPKAKAVAKAKAKPKAKAKAAPKKAASKSKAKAKPAAKGGKKASSAGQALADKLFKK